MKAIETKYKGYRFRSRLEARWAVLFDAMGVAWDYEKEGFELNGEYYLPDFWLPDQQVWVEIKGLEPSDRELRVAHALADQSQRPVAIVNGGWNAWESGPDRTLCVGQYVLPACAAGQNRSAVESMASLYHCASCDNFAVLSLRDSDWTCFVCGLSWMPLYTDRLEAAVDAARSARFEHGESGIPRPAPPLTVERKLREISPERATLEGRIGDIDVELAFASNEEREALLLEKLDLAARLRALSPIALWRRT